MIQFGSLLIYDEEVLLVDLEIVSNVICDHMEQQLWEALLVNVDGHDTDFGLDKYDLVVEWGDCDLDWGPVVDAEEAHDVRGDV